MPDRSDEEQEDFEPFDTGERPYYFDRPPGTGTPPPLRPDQQILYVPHLEQAFVIPRWTRDNTPSGWTLQSADIDVPSLTRTKATFLFRRDTDSRVVAVMVAWSPEWTRLLTMSGEPDTFELIGDDLNDDVVRLEDTALERAVVFIDILTMVGTAATHPSVRRALLDAIGIRPDQDAS